MNASKDVTTEPPIEFCNRVSSGLKKKADHNKIESLLCFLLVIVSTLVAPLFVTLGTGLVFGKIIPSILSLLAAGATAWLQLRKPQQLWTLYRSAQRELEDYAARFNYQLGEFEDSSTREKLLAAKVADIAIGVHHQWVPLVPNPEKLQIVEKAGTAKQSAKQ